MAESIRHESKTPDLASVDWDLDVIISESGRGQILEPSVGLQLKDRSGSVTHLQFPKAQLVRFRRELAVIKREMDALRAKGQPRPSGS